MSGTAETVILRLLAQRGEGKTICPSEAARSLRGAGWRTGMDEVHTAARALAERGRVRLEQRRTRVAPGAVRGPYRIAGCADGA